MTLETSAIVGASLAGGTAAAQLRKDGFDGRVVLVGAEPDRPCERPALSKAYLRRTAERAKLDAHGSTFYSDKAIELRTSTRVTAVEPRGPPPERAPPALRPAAARHRRHPATAGDPRQ